MPKAQVQGVQLEYVEKGAGTPVVLVHGSASDWRTWSAQLDAFSKGHRVVAYSRRYHWPNAPIAEGADYAMHEHATDLAAFVRALGLAPAHLVGHSYGAFVALLAALREPQIARTVVLGEPPVTTLLASAQPRLSELARLALTRPRTLAALLAFGARGPAPATAAARRGDLDGAMRIFGQAVLGPAYYRRLSRSRLEQVQANAIKAELLGSGFPKLDAGEVRQLRLPVLLVEGTDSPAIFHRLMDALEDIIPLARRTSIAKASHNMHEDDAVAYNAAVLSFLAHHSQGQS